MNIKNQVCSLELAKKLKELGVPQVSLWRWIDYGDESRIAGQMEFGFATGSEVYSAFTVAELGEMMPKNFSTAWFPDADCPDERYWDIVYNSVHYAIEATEADARAKALICLIGEEIVNVKKLAEAEAPKK